MLISVIIVTVLNTSRISLQKLALCYPFSRNKKDVTVFIQHVYGSLWR